MVKRWTKLMAFVVTVHVPALAEESTCDARRAALQRASARAATCERKLNTAACQYSAWCDKTEPCLKAARCANMACGTVRDKCARGDKAACVEVPTVCVVCAALSDDCSKCNPALATCEREALKSEACHDSMVAYQASRFAWMAYCPQ